MTDDQHTKTAEDEAELEGWSLRRSALLRLPEHMRESARLYVEEGKVVEDGFIAAVARNDLRRSFQLADPANTTHMGDWVAFFYYDVPSGAWGSREAVTTWASVGGLRGLRAMHKRAAVASA